MPASSRPDSRPSATKILFVCVGNSCRSQMAEAFANLLGDGRVVAYSAGSAPLGIITKDTYTVMKERGLSLEDQWSKALGDVPVADMDTVVTMGREVACPVPAGFKGRMIAWSIPDPYLRGPRFFRDVRDMIEQQVLALLGEMSVRNKPETTR